LDCAPADPAVWGLAPGQANTLGYRGEAIYKEHKARVEADLVARLARAGREPNRLLEVDGPRQYTDVTFTRGDVLVFGRESTGLPRDLLATSPERHLSIPSRPQVRSLNLANCVALVAYEAVRQWGGLKP
jgi:tRNA(Leu) C34 or U34 (ribose-2'-O)-methylase TrmL